MESVRAQWRLLIILFLIITDMIIWYAVYRESPNSYATIAFLNVGQGDAIYIESPTRNQLIIDGGPGRALMPELTKLVPFYDRSVDAIMVTNPDTDHYSGFIDLLRSYDVKTVIEPGTQSQTERYNTFGQEVQNERAQKIVARRGMIIDLGGGAYVKILYPDIDVSQMSTNDGSIIAQFVYGSTTIMLTGDAPSKIEEKVLILDGTFVQSDILKIGHHGSKTSASEKFIDAVDPQYAIISAGCNNRYGHPHKETVDILEKENIKMLTTCREGTIVFKLDGKQDIRQ